MCERTLQLPGAAYMLLALHSPGPSISRIDEDTLQPTLKAERRETWF